MQFGAEDWHEYVGDCCWYDSLCPHHLGRVAKEATGHYSNILPTKAIIAGPFLAVFGGECVFQSTIFTLTSALAGEYVERYVETMQMLRF